MEFKRVIGLVAAKVLDSNADTLRVIQPGLVVKVSQSVLSLIQKHVTMPVS